MSLHYLVKLEMLIAHVLSLSFCHRKKLKNLSYFNYVLQLRQIRIQLITACVKYCKRRCTKYALLISSYQRRRWQMAATMTTVIQLGPLRSQSLFKFVQISDAYFV